MGGRGGSGAIENCFLQILSKFLRPPIRNLDAPFFVCQGKFGWYCQIIMRIILTIFDNVDVGDNVEVYDDDGWSDDVIRW